MTVAVANDLKEVIAHMRPGAAYRLGDVGWDEYEQLLAELGEGYAARIFYDAGKMEIMSPSYRHERPVKVFHRMLTTISDELDIDVESAGATTLKDEWREKGAEPDESYYVQNAALMIGKADDLDLTHDPPPDLVIESDRTSSSLNKFPIYAALGVPEIWRIHQLQVVIWVLADDHYEASPNSRAFPFLSADTLLEFLEKGLAEGERKGAQAFREWLRKQRPNLSPSLNTTTNEEEI